jgi:hypothetical protein
MLLARPAFAPHPRLFGRGRIRDLTTAGMSVAPSPLATDVKLFATTFIAGFLFVSILIS